MCHASGLDPPEQVVEEGGIDTRVDEEEVAQALRELMLGMSRALRIR